MAEPHKADEIDTWDAVHTPPTPKLDHPTMVDMFVYLLEVEGHRAIDPDATNAYGYSAGPNPYCGVSGKDRGACPSCVALRLHYYGHAAEVETLLCPSCGREQDHVGGTQETPFCPDAFHVFGLRKEK